MNAAVPFGQHVDMRAVPSDAEVIGEALHGDPFRFSAIFDRHYDAIFRYLARRAGRDLAEDLAAEVFMTAFARLSSYDLTRPDARPWLYGIATNLLRRHRRSETRRLRAWARAVDHTAEDAIAELLDGVDAARLGVRIASGLAALSGPDRDVLCLTALGGLSAPEIAELQGVPAGTVRSRLHRARRILREHIGDFGQYSSEGTATKTREHEDDDT